MAALTMTTCRAWTVRVRPIRAPCQDTNSVSCARSKRSSQTGVRPQMLLDVAPVGLQQLHIALQTTSRGCAGRRPPGRSESLPRYRGATAPAAASSCGRDGPHRWSCRGPSPVAGAGRPRGCPAWGAGATAGAPAGSPWASASLKTLRISLRTLRLVYALMVRPCVSSVGEVGLQRLAPRGFLAEGGVQGALLGAPLPRAAARYLREVFMVLRATERGRAPRVCERR